MVVGKIVFGSKIGAKDFFYGKIESEVKTMNLISAITVLIAMCIVIIAYRLGLSDACKMKKDNTVGAPVNFKPKAPKQAAPSEELKGIIDGITNILQYDGTQQK